MYRYLIIFFVSFLLYSCARITGKIEGGPKDTFGPSIDSLGSTTNFQTLFSEKEITLVFDEWIVLKNIGNIIISPPIQDRIIKAQGKKLTIEIGEEEILKDSTTYVINFGESIQDFTEGNPIENYQFVFSTGDYIDSLKISGTVIDVLTREPVENVNIQMYSNLQDSILYLEKPDYIAKTNKEGVFTISNIRQDSFLIYALEDANSSMRFDQSGERISFLDSFVVLNDTTNYQFTFPIFQEERIFQKGIRIRKNKYSIALSSQLDTVRFLNPHLDVNQTIWENDSIHIWFSQNSAVLDSTILLMTDRNVLIDTLPWKLSEQFDSLQCRTDSASSFQQQFPSDWLNITFNNLVDSVDAAFVIVTDTSKNEVAFQVKSDTKNCQIKGSFKDTSIYEITLLPGAILDVYHQTNDTLQYVVKTKMKEDFGAINLVFNAVNDSTQYVASLLKKEKVIQTLYLKNGDNRLLNGIAPGDYSMKIIEDLNGNGRWDTGHLLEKRRPENIRTFTIETVRANWDINVNLEWNNEIKR